MNNPIDTDGVKLCNKCKVYKPFSDFDIRQRANGSTGYYYVCKPCKNVLCQEWRDSDRDKFRALARKSQVKTFYRGRKYGLSRDGYDAILASQGNACAICLRDAGAIVRESNREMSIDHCHSTNIVRGVLCVKCNTILGQAGDSEAILLSAIDYLRRSRSIASKAA